MAKKKPSKSKLTVETLKHEDATRKNIPTAEHQSVMHDADLETTATDGKNYKTRYYNLDAIIAVGYRGSCMT